MTTIYAWQSHIANGGDIYELVYNIASDTSQLDAGNLRRTLNLRNGLDVMDVVIVAPKMVRVKVRISQAGRLGAILGGEFVYEGSNLLTLQYVVWHRRLSGPVQTLANVNDAIAETVTDVGYDAGKTAARVGNAALGVIDQFPKVVLWAAVAYIGVLAFQHSQVGKGA